MLYVREKISEFIGINLNQSEGIGFSLIGSDGLR